MSDISAAELARLQSDLCTQTAEAARWRSASEHMADELRDAEAHTRELTRALEDANARCEELRKRTEELEGELEEVRKSGGFG